MIMDRYYSFLIRIFEICLIVLGDEIITEKSTSLLLETYTLTFKRLINNELIV